MSIRVAVIGTGWWATRAHLPALVAEPDAEIVALVDPDVDKLKCAARAFGVSRGYPDVGSLLESDAIDAAVVAVPHSLHAEVARACLAAGAHILVEKPMTVDPADAFGLLELAAEAEREIVVGYTWHYSPQVLEIREAIAAGRIGHVEAASCLYASVLRELYRGRPERYRDVLGYTLNATSEATYRDTALSGGGQGQWQVTHAAALLGWLTGLEAAQVSAFTADHDVGMDLVDAISIRFDGGAIGTLASTGGVVPTQPETLEYRIFGTDGHVFFDVYAGTASIHLADGSVETLPELPEEERYPEWAPVQNLVAVAQGREANGSPPLLGARTVAFVDAMYRSARDGCATRPYGYGTQAGGST